ncbi:S24 family peptidase [uncultured Pseudoramibacter sp.]|uniref:helix-turn-helix domain-containing protein n=1 Tax=uncultured Pseudoramibacter sp. TaxID=1623493 RepID=UPI0025F842BE|nr:S24 family peptidase [uncultured Pseudoramibacter sp.]
MTLYTNIRKRRKELNLTQDELAALTGYSGKSMIAKIESGKVDISQSKIVEFAKALKTTPAKLMGWDSENQSGHVLNRKPKLKGIPSNIITPGAVPIPILGEICAGDGIYGEENFKGTFFIDQSVKADYCLIVHGDSMIDAGIYDGDIAFLQKDFELIDGEIYAVVFGAEDSATLKQLYRDGKTVILQPCNKEYKPIIVDYVDLYVVGLLVGVYHKID